MTVPSESANTLALVLRWEFVPDEGHNDQPVHLVYRKINLPHIMFLSALFIGFFLSFVF